MGEIIQPHVEYDRILPYLNFDGVDNIVLVAGVGRSGSTTMGRVMGRYVNNKPTHNFHRWWYQPGKSILRMQQAGKQNPEAIKIAQGVNADGTVVLKESICFTDEESLFNPLELYLEYFIPSQIRVIFTVQHPSKMLESWLRNFSTDKLGKEKLTENFHSAYRTFIGALNLTQQFNITHTLYHPSLVMPNSSQNQTQASMLALEKMMEKIGLFSQDPERLSQAVNWNAYNMYETYVQQSGVLVPPEPDLNAKTINCRAMETLMRTTGLTHIPYVFQEGASPEVGSTIMDHYNQLLVQHDLSD